MKQLRIRRVPEEQRTPGERYLVMATQGSEGNAYYSEPCVLEFYDTFTEEVTPVEFVDA